LESVIWSQGLRILPSKTFAATKLLATVFFQVPTRSTFFKRLVLGATLWQQAKMSTILKNSKGLKDLECEKGQLSSWPPIPYVPPTDLSLTKQSSENLKVKLLDGTVLTMTIFSWKY
jgi:hypothetical protein